LLASRNPDAWSKCGRFQIPGIVAPAGADEVAAVVGGVSPGPAETLIMELGSGMAADGLEGRHRDRALRSRCTQISTSSSARRGESPQPLLGRLFSTQPLVCQLDIYIATND
jgi:hypothetical protein